MCNLTAEEIEIRAEQAEESRARLERRISSLQYAIENALDYMEDRIEDTTLRGILKEALDNS